MKKREKKAAEKRPFFTVTNLVASVVCFVVFLAVALGGYYLSAGEFVSGTLAAVYAILALVGAVPVLLRLYRFVALYYTGCVIGWALGWFVGGLKGDFAPTAGTICTVFFILVFTFFGAILQWKGLRQAMARRHEEKQAARAEAEEQARLDALDRARQEREDAADAMDEAFGVEPMTPEAAFHEAACLTFAEEENVPLEAPHQPAAMPEAQPAGDQTFTAVQEPVVTDQPLPHFPEGAVPADPGPMAAPEAEKTAAAPQGAAAAEAEDKPQI